MYRYYILITSLTSSPGFAVTLTSNLTASVRQFGNDLYYYLPNETSNAIVSPFSAHAALSMIYMGSVGETYEILRVSLNFLDKYNQSMEYRKIMKRHNDKGAVLVVVTNMIFLQSQYQINDQYARLMQYYFGGNVTSVDFKKCEAAWNTINKSVAKKTNNAIPHIISPYDLDESTRFVLLNSLYLKGKWEHEFAQTSTVRQRFYVNQNETVYCHMMTQTNHFQYYKSEKPLYQVIQLKLEQPSYSMIIVLPKLRDFDTVVAHISNENATFVTVENKLVSKLVKLSLPKFKFDIETELNKPLTELGLDNIFSNSANFSKIISSNESLKVDKILQKSYIEVHELGIETAPVAGTTITEKEVPSPAEEATVSFNANKPFIFYIIEEVAEGALPNILFMGRLNLPTIMSTECKE